MKNNNWHGIMKIIEIQHLDSNNNIIWQAKNIYNLLHSEGEQFLLQAAFTGGKNSTVIPEYYYLGLDNRDPEQVDVSNDMADLTGEPLSGGYQRVAIPSLGTFAINYDQDHYVATSPIVSFNSLSGTWGPVRNLFLTAPVQTQYKLISTAVLPSPIFLNFGQTVTMRIGLQIRDNSAV